MRVPDQVRCEFNMDVLGRVAYLMVVVSHPEATLDVFAEPVLNMLLSRHFVTSLVT